MRISDWSSDVCSSDLRKGFDYALREVLAFQPTMTDSEAAAVRAVSAAIEEVLGRPATQVVSPGTNDQKHVVRVGELEDCIAYAPGIRDIAQQPDAYVGIDDQVPQAKGKAVATWALRTEENQ